MVGDIFPACKEKGVDIGKAVLVTLRMYIARIIICEGSIWAPLMLVFLRVLLEIFAVTSNTFDIAPLEESV